MAKNNFEAKKPERRGKVKPQVPSKPQALNPAQSGFVEDWYKLFFPVFCKPERKMIEPQGTVVLKDYKTEVHFYHTPNGFPDSSLQLGNDIADNSINLLVADTNYGFNKAPWDSTPWNKTEFKAAVELVHLHNKGLDTVRFCFFVTDQQLLDLFSVLVENKLTYRLLTWVKPQHPGSQGSRLRQDTEHLVLAWSGNEADLVNNIDKNDPNRYSTVLVQNRLRRYLKDAQNNKVNPYQKPIKVMQKIIQMTCPGSRNSTIVDITCGTGTTAVSSLYLCSPRCSTSG